MKKVRVSVTFQERPQGDILPGATLGIGPLYRFGRAVDVFGWGLRAIDVKYKTVGNVACKRFTYTFKFPADKLGALYETCSNLAPQAAVTVTTHWESK